MESDVPTFAQDEPAPQNPKRVWDASRRCWVEAMSVCRSPAGTFARKNGSEPDAQLALPFGRSAA